MMRIARCALAAITLSLIARGALADETEEDPNVPPPPPKRSGSELVLLYVAGIGWGGSAGMFVDGMTQTNNANASADLLGGVGALVGSGVGCLLPIVVDTLYDKRRGVAQTVSSSMFLGLGEGIALNEFFSNHQSTSFHTFTKDTAWIFGGATVGLATGLLIARTVHTTPGRAAWIETTGLFSGVLAASIVGAASRPFNDNSIANVGIAGALVGAAGIAGGIATASWLSPKALRVHLIDLGWVTGTLASVAACARCNPSDAFAATAVGATLGFVGMFFATLPIPADRGPTAPPPQPVFSLAPFAMPMTGGVQVGVGGSL